MTGAVVVRRRPRLVAVALRDLARLEPRVRRQGLARLCQDNGLAFGGFAPTGEAAQAPEPPRPLPRHVAEAMWATETALALWPLARRRRCLRRGLVLGRQIAYLDPRLMIEVTSVSPMRMHAYLMVRGNRLDVGTLDGLTTTDGVGATP